MTTTVERPDSTTTTTDEFAERVFNAGLETADVFSMYIGEKLGLYRALAEHGPLTRDDLTRHADIHWRYAQEWLEQQTVTGILAVDDAGLGPAERRYSLPPAQAEVLLDPDSLAYLSPFVRILMAGGLALPELIEAYRTGGGVGWARFGSDARTGQSEMNRPWYLQSIGEEWFPAFPELHDRLVAGGRVADIACGEGWSTIAIALSYPKATVDGYDIDHASIEAARVNAVQAGVADRVTFHVADAADLPAEGVYDAVVGFEFIHDLPHPVSTLEAMRRIAREGAPILVMDENVPDEFTGNRNDVERLMYGFSLLVCLPDGMSHSPSAATGTVIRESTMRGYATEAGFTDVEILPVENDLWRFYRMVH
jgi:2-polyprenyl-3-methyl-5-hydroxy-6-metoxy-1,4-benzoquinol methylase